MDTFLKRKDKLGTKELDLASPAIRMLVKYLLDTIREAMVSSGERDEMIRTVFAKFTQMMNDDTWRTDLKNRMKNAI